MDGDAGTGVQGTVTLRSAELQKAIAAIANPALRTSINRLLGDLGDPGAEPQSVKREYGEARDRANKEFDLAQKVAAASVKQDILQSGARFGGRATDVALGRTARGIDRGRQQTLGALDFEEASAGLNQTNYLLSALMKGGSTALGGALGYGSNALGAGSIMSAQAAQNRQQGSTYGAMAGTILGALLSPYTAGMSIPIGSALGGAAGGYLAG